MGSKFLWWLVGNLPWLKAEPLLGMAIEQFTDFCDEWLKENTLYCWLVEKLRDKEGTRKFHDDFSKKKPGETRIYLSGS